MFLNLLSLGLAEKLLPVLAGGAILPVPYKKP